MLPSQSILLGLSLGLAQVNAHFLLNYPPSLGFDDDKAATAPCGGFDVTLDNTTDFHVGGDAIALLLLHPTGNWLFRATLDATAAGNWSVLLPLVAQQGQGAFCEQGVKVPSSFVGQKGVIQVVGDLEDGQLYQCAAVNFVSGASSSIPSACLNGTNVQAVFTTDAILSTIAIAGAATATATATASGASTTASAASAATPSPSKSASTSTLSGYATTSCFWGAAVALGSIIVAIGL